MIVRLMGSQRCEECDGEGEISYGERHGFDARDKCPACHGRGIVPIYNIRENRRKAS